MGAKEIKKEGARLPERISGEPAEAEQVQELLGSLFARGSGESIAAEIARHEIGEILTNLLERIEASACRSPSDDCGKWAGRILGDILSAVGKREKSIAVRSPSFKSRMEELRSISDLIHKPSPSQATLWTIMAYERITQVERMLALSEALGLSQADVCSCYGFSDLESTFGKKIAEVMELPEAERGDSFFSAIVWPWLCEHREEISSEEWAQKAIQKNGGRDQWAPSFANLKGDFRKTWKTVYSRPEGGLRGIERPAL